MKRYVVMNDCDEYYEYYVGTLEEILEHISDESWSISYCEFYELGKKVEVELSLK